MTIRYPEATAELSPAPLSRRLAAILYDSLIVIALLMVTTGIYKLVQAGVLGEEQLRQLTDSGKMDTDPLLSSILFIVLYVFFAYFWTKNGQTLGMQVWHIRVQTREGFSISWSQALLRFMMAWVSALLGGVGYFWALIDKDKRSWHDIFSMTVVVRIPRKKAL
jgi:uncharacterized RDD family membrane protein YckC